MLTKPSTRLESLSSEDLDLLTQLLSLPPGDRPTAPWLTGQQILISTFPPSLQTPTTLSYRLSSSHKAPLCCSHKGLPSPLIHEMFLHISAECTMHLRRLNEQAELPEKISAFLRRMQHISSLWISRQAYLATFPDFKDEGLVKPITSGCEACILAAVGGNRRMLSDLLASMLGRKKKNRLPPPLMPVVQAWLDWTGEGSELVKAAAKLGRMICAYRKEMQKARRARQCAERGGDQLAQVEESEKYGALLRKRMGCKDECGQEDEIVELYATRLTTSKEFQHMDPFVRSSAVSEAKTGPWKRSRLAYTESVYDRSDLGGPTDSTLGGTGELAAEDAENYRKLMSAENKHESKDVNNLENLEEYIGPRAGWKQNWSLSMI